MFDELPIREKYLFQNKYLVVQEESFYLEVGTLNKKIPHFFFSPNGQCPMMSQVIIRVGFVPLLPKNK